MACTSIGVRWTGGGAKKNIIPPESSNCGDIITSSHYLKMNGKSTYVIEHTTDVYKSKMVFTLLLNTWFTMYLPKYLKCVTVNPFEVMLALNGVFSSR